jgi:type II secretory pathway pseudopilin PulG
MKKQKGFIQIPILIAIIAGVLIISGVGYIGVRQYQSYQAKKIEEVKQSQEKERLSQANIKTQQEQLEKAQQEIETLKQKQTEQENKPPQIVVKETIKQINISSNDIDPYLTGVQSVSCYNSMGSGSLWFLDQTYLILTNKHVVGLGQCEMDFENKDRKTIGFYGLDTQRMYSKNQETDSAFIPIELDPSINPHVESAPLSMLNYKISSLKKCQTKMPIGSPVVLIGYPIYGRKIVDDSGGWVGYKVTTDGIISGYDDFLSGKYGNYFVSAKIDSGNSGGIAFSKDENGLCVLGIPTWLTVGNYETQGIVQNIYNVFYSE